MQNKDDTAAATKLDVKMLMETLGDMSVSIEQIRVEAKESKEELRQEMKDAICASEEGMKYEFRLLTEVIRNDLLDAKKDRVAQHHDTLTDHTRRIVRIEQKLAI